MQLFRVSLMLLSLAVFPLSAGAQALLPSSDAITFIVTPTYPRPYDTITISPRSTLLNLSESVVTISVNGEIVQEGTGTRSAQATMAGPGSATVITVSAKDPTGAVYTKELTLRAADVSLVMEPISSSHPYYEGASLVAPEGRVRLVALPDFRGANGAVIPPETLVYSWKNGEKQLTDQSGIGRSVLDGVAPLRYRNANITVTVTSQDRLFAGSASVLVAPVEPSVYVYRTYPLLGTWLERAIGSSATLTDTEDSYRAVGYNFRRVPSFAWTVNGQANETDDDITVRITTPGSGTAQVGVTARAEGLFQQAAKTFALNFSSGNSLGIFGL